MAKRTAKGKTGAGSATKPKKREYSCQTCDFKGPNPMAVKRHYSENPKHRKVGPVATTRKPGRPRKVSAVDGMTLAELRQEVAARRQVLEAERAERNRLVAELNEVNAEVDAIGGSPKPRKRARKNGMTLTEALEKVLKRRTKGMRAKDLVAAVLKAGYKTKSKELYPMVAAALRDRARFRKVVRGVYAVNA